MSNQRRGGSLDKYHLGTYRSPSNGDFGPYLDAAAYYELYPDLIDYEMHTKISDLVSRKVPTFLGPKSDMLEIFRQRMVQRTTTKAFIEMRMELPEEEMESRVLKVHEAPTVLKLGANEAEWEMTIDSKGFNRKSWFQLEEAPHILIRPVNDPIPDGRGGKATWRIANGHRDDYIKREILEGSKIRPIGAPLEEHAHTRGTLDFQGGGKSHLHYKFDMTRMGYEMVITDEMWQAANYFTLERNDKDASNPSAPVRITLSDIERKFHDAVEVVYDDYLTAGSSYSPEDGVLTDDVTRRGYRLGPTWIEFLRASGAHTYSFYNFNIDRILDQFKRKLDLTDLDMRDRMFEIITGSVGYEHVIEPELRRKDIESVNDKSLSYKEVESIGGQGRVGVIPGVKQYVGGFLGVHGEYRVHISDMLNKGKLCGNQQFKGYPISSSWIMVMLGKKGEENKMENFILYTNEMMEQKGYLVGSWTPSGPAAKVANKGRFSSAGDLGNAYKVIDEMYKGIFVQNFNDLGLYFPDVKTQKRAK